MNLAYASGRESYRLDLHKKSPVRKAVLTRFLTIRELKNKHFAYASGRADDRPDGVNWRPFDRPIDRSSIGMLGSIALQPVRSADRSLNAVPDQIKAFERENEEEVVGSEEGRFWRSRAPFLGIFVSFS